MLKQRYETGLEKLDFAASQVSVMQQELKDLQPELVKTSAETEKLLAKIEQDTVEVEAKKEVSSCLLNYFVCRINASPPRIIRRSWSLCWRQTQVSLAAKNDDKWEITL